MELESMGEVRSHTKNGVWCELLSGGVIYLSRPDDKNMLGKIGNLFVKGM